MKHAWILNHYAQEPSAPGGTRHYSLAKHLPEHGWTASIIAASTEHHTGRDRLLAGEICRLDNFDGVPFLWLHTSRYYGNGSRRVLNMISFFRQALRRSSVARLQRPDIVIGSSVHPLAALAGYHLARRHGVPFVFEVRDLWPQTLIELGRLRPGSAQAIALRYLERFLYRRSCRIITLLPRASDYIRPLGIPDERIIWIPNGADQAVIPVAVYAPPDNGQFTLMYLGAHGEVNGLDTLLDAMKIVQSDSASGSVKLRMIGEGPEKAALQQRAAALALHNVIFEPPVPKKQVPEMLAHADAFVACLRDLPQLYRFGISLNKVFDYLAAGRPIIFASGAVNDPVADAGAGISTPPGDPQLLAAAILKMAFLPVAERKRMGQAGQRHIEQHYSYRQLAAKLAETLDECCRLQT
jgi:glycosyltransferase involved in cell wall biosynthesis